jgi:predicted acylesterase/phospholipase RssA
MLVSQRSKIAAFHIRRKSVRFLSVSKLNSQYSSKFDSTLSVSFGGCGFLLPYHAGVALKLFEQGLINEQSKFAGASGGAIIAAALAGKIPLGLYF